MAKEYRDLIVGLDIGTSKIMCVVAEVQADAALKVLGLGVSPSSGMKRGVVVNIDACVQSILQAVREAELMAACKITRVITGITGSHIRGRNSTGMVAVRDREVSPADVAKVLETARAINISTDQRPLRVEPQEFVIDGQEVKEPIGMSGIRLESKVHIVTCAQSAAENILKCVRRCGLEVDHLMLNPLAASMATLTEDAEDGEEANGYVSIWATDAEGTLLDGFNASLAEGEQLLAGETWTFEKRIGSWVTPEQEDTIETGSVGYRLIR